MGVTSRTGIRNFIYLPYIKNVIKEIYMYIHRYKPYLCIIYINLNIYIIYINHIYT